MKKEFLIETDILIDHLTANDKNENTALEVAMQTGVCFTTVLNAGELYFTVKNPEEKNAVDKLLRSLKVLGLHSRYSLEVGEFREKTNSLRDAMICVVSKINRLPVLTNNKEKYKFAGIDLVSSIKLGE